MNPSNTAIILFVRNPVLGKVKTRLAKTIGDEKALKVYKLLLAHTLDITKELNCQKFVYYSEEIQTDDLWSEPGFIKRLQKGNDLGDRMYDAFKTLFDEGFEKVLIIGSDCYQLTKNVLLEGISQLEKHDTLLGPAFDGGYYLLGMKRLIPEVFENKLWSSDSVLSETISDLGRLSLSYLLLPVLNDVDEEADLVKSNILY